MGLFGTIQQIITGKTQRITEPVFLREDTSAEKELEQLQQLKRTVSASLAKQLEQDIKTVASGISGENNVAYELKNSFMPLLILRDLHLKYGDLSAQIDFVVISAHFVLVIECKKLIDDIEITEKGDFLRCFRTATGIPYKKEGIYSPVTQNQRHVDLIKKIFSAETKNLSEKKCNTFLRSIVVLANPKTVVRDLSAPEEVKRNIIKYDQLITFMKSLSEANKSDVIFTDEAMQGIARVLLRFHTDETYDYAQKYHTQPKAKTTPSAPRAAASKKAETKRPEPEKAKTLPQTEPSDQAAPLCPKCGVPMVLRTAQKGKNAGSRFYGCPNFPKCRQIINVDAPAAE